MKVSIVGVIAALALAGCAPSSVLDIFGAGKSSAPQAGAVPQGNNLAMPPDLQLKAPAETASQDYQPNTVGSPPPGNDVALAAPAPVVARPAPAPAPDIYEQYGISRTNPDGSPRDKAVLEKELKAAMIAKKRQANPRYGTIFNIGNIFRDE
jgi:hypothetical protein